MALSLHVAVRTLHVLGAAVLLGGAGAVWYLAREGDPRVGRVARHYEWVFWGAVGVMVVTGVGNFGSLGAPGPHTRWGSILSAKLGVVVAFVLGSAVRTNAVALAAADPSRSEPTADEPAGDRPTDGEPAAGDVVADDPAEEPGGAERADGGTVAARVRTYRRLYGATTVVLVALVVLAEVLAHG